MTLVDEYRADLEARITMSEEAMIQAIRGRDQKALGDAARLRLQLRAAYVACFGDAEDAARRAEEWARLRAEVAKA